jgi:spore germination protein GerM
MPRLPAWLLVAAGIVAVGCGVPTHGPVDVGPAPAAGSQEESTAAAADSTTIAVTIYLTDGGILRPVTRRVPRTPRVGTETLAALFVGPTSHESARGLTTEIPRGASLLGLVIDQGLATVNLSSGFQANSDAASLRLRLAQVACTLATFPTVTSIRFAFDGRPTDIPSGDGTMTSRPVACASYSRYLPGSAQPK